MSTSRSRTTRVRTARWASARALGVGPSIRYASQGGWLFTLKWQKDFEVRNRPEGNQLLAKLVIPF